MQIDKLNLEVGKTYSALMKGYEIDDEEGKVYVFEDEIIKIEIIEKPEYVMIDDGPNGELIKTKLTGHLLESHWYLVENFTTGTRQWFSVLHREIINELTNAAICNVDSAVSITH